jgi:hypothetical protein
MAVTLAQASLNAASDIDRLVIDEFRKNSFILANLPFDQAVNPAGGGSTLTYGYTRQKTQRAAAFRTINQEYVPTEVTKEQITTDLRPLGGAFEIDRVLAGIGAVSEVSFQMAQVIKAAKTYFTDQVINGDVGVTTNGFDGLNVALTDSITEETQLLDFTGVTTQAAAFAVLRALNTWLRKMDGTPSALIMNALALGWFETIAGFSNQLRSTRDAFGEEVLTYRNIPLIDAMTKAGSNDDIIPTYGTTSEVQHVDITGATGGTYTLSFGGETTAPIAYNETTANIVTALNLLSNVRSGDIVGSGAYPNHVFTFAQDYAGTNVPMLVATDSTTVAGNNITITQAVKGGTGAGGLTDIYAVRFGLDGFHGVSVVGPLIQQWMPDFTKAGAVKTGEVEMGPVAVALKASRAAAVHRNIKVA